MLTKKRGRKKIRRRKKQPQETSVLKNSRSRSRRSLRPWKRRLRILRKNRSPLRKICHPPTTQNPPPRELNTKRFPPGSKQPTQGGRNFHRLFESPPSRFYDRAGTCTFNSAPSVSAGIPTYFAIL